MEGHAFSMGPSGDSSASEHGLEGSYNIFSANSSSRRDHGDQAEGTARAQQKRKRTNNWSGVQTQQLLVANLKLNEEKVRARKRTPKWQIISESVNGKNALECRRRMETLTKSVKQIKEYGAVHHKEFNELTEEDFTRLKLATKMEADWYDQMCEITKQPQDAMVVPSPDSADQSISSSPSPVAVMAGPEDDTFGEVVGTPVPAWPERDPPRSTSPTDLQSHCSAAPGHPTLADPHHHSVNGVEAWIETLLSSPPHVPAVDRESSPTFERLEAFEHLDDL